MSSTRSKYLLRGWATCVLIIYCLRCVSWYLDRGRNYYYETRYFVLGSDKFDSQIVSNYIGFSIRNFPGNSLGSRFVPV